MNFSPVINVSNIYMVIFRIRFRFNEYLKRKKTKPQMVLPFFYNNTSYGERCYYAYLLTMLALHTSPEIDGIQFLPQNHTVSFVLHLQTNVPLPFV